MKARQVDKELSELSMRLRLTEQRLEALEKEFVGRYGSEYLRELIARHGAHPEITKMMEEHQHVWHSDCD